MGWIIFLAFVVTFYCLARRAALRLEAQGKGFLYRNFVGWMIGGFVAAVQSMLLVGGFDISTVLGLAICAGSVWLYRQPLFPSAVEGSGFCNK